MTLRVPEPPRRFDWMYVLYLYAILAAIALLVREATR